jgi:hypothetical protein
MALVLLQPGTQPLGQFDGLDAITTTVKGGEVLTFTTVLKNTATVTTDLAAADAGQDGYEPPSAGTTRPVLTTNLVSGNRPLMLCDDGLLHYGTLFGEVVGGTVGQTSYGPNSSVPASALLGPHTAAGSGKLTAWDKQGLYGVTLDAVDTTAQTGLVTTNTSLTAGSSLYATSAGLLTPNPTKSFESSGATTALVVGNFIEFTTNGSLVTTPNRLVSALNSPSSTVGGVLTTSQYMAVFHFSPDTSRVA